ncbi:MAG: hypothetical protein Q4F40_08465, partial [Akkermansia sp.]|nr:hypothetical protein [Akkermansia sp.]
MTQVTDSTPVNKQLFHFMLPILTHPHHQIKSNIITAQSAVLNSEGTPLTRLSITALHQQSNITEPQA